MDNKIKHLEMIQQIIDRMAKNSFSLKGWTVTLISGILFLSTKSEMKSSLFIVYIPIIGFWTLDGYYLQQERIFRAIYDVVRTSDNDFKFSINPKEILKHHKKNKWKSCILSKTECIFYIPIAISPILLYILVFGGCR
jgi:hypothetical protein